MKRGPAPTWIPLRRQLLDSSIWEENAVVCKLWVTLLIVGSEPGRRGTIDMTPRALAGRACMSEEEVSAALEVLMAPDPRSRSRVAEGRRVELLDKERPWGWRLVNWEAYEETMAAAGTTMRSRKRRTGNAPKRTGTHRNAPEPAKEKEREKEKEKEREKEKEAEELRSSSAREDGASAPSRPSPSSGVIAAYEAAFHARYSFPPAPTKEEIIAVNQALKGIAPAEREAIMRAFVEDEDPWLSKQAHRLGLLPKQLGRIRAKLAGTLSEGRREPDRVGRDCTIPRDAQPGIDVLP